MNDALLDQLAKCASNLSIEELVKTASGEETKASSASTEQKFIAVMRGIFNGTDR